MQSSTVEAFGMLMVLEMAPEMKDWAAAIMRIWLETERKRLPIRPQGLAQSKIEICSSLRRGGPPPGITPQAKVVGALISPLVESHPGSMAETESVGFAVLRAQGPV